ncbi:alpha/beta-hydrolase [Clavulina sp. PMI_390]|nr:alpha/beta-hydrolase [Clavulina sp. PMI_390]
MSIAKESLQTDSLPSGPASKFTPRFDPERVSQMKEMLKLSSLPEASVQPLDDPESDIGIKLEFVAEAKAALEAYDVEEFERKLNKMNHFLAPIEDVNLHFIHERSERPDAIPLLIIHGWPGAFYDFRKIIDPLVHPTDPSQPAFHLVAPSLPGYAWSTSGNRFGSSEFSRCSSLLSEGQPSSLTFLLTLKTYIVDMARIFNKLMVEVLGYNKYVGQGGDWGGHIMRPLALYHSDHMRLVHFNMFFCQPAEGIASYTPWLNHLPLPQSTVDWLSTQIKEWGVPEAQLRLLRQFQGFLTGGSGYVELQSTRPATVGYAIASSPLSLLTYIGEKKLAWQDPATFELDDLLATVSLYYLTSTFQTSVMIYQQSLPRLRQILTDTSEAGKIKIPTAFSAFPYELEAPPRDWIAQYVPLVQYRVHDKGGHFPAVENPTGLVEDLQSFYGPRWKTA